jgi:putative tricarboxylic transport membrane protein
MAKADLVMAVVFVLLGAAILYGSWTMPRLEARGVHPLTVPGLVPGMLSAALIICGALMGLRTLRTHTGSWRSLLAALTGDQARRAAVVIALALVYTLGLVGWLPFWAATFLFVFAFVVVFELWFAETPRPLIVSLPWAVGLAVVTSAVVVLVFERAFLVRLP